jgi:hypothetical protein
MKRALLAVAAALAVSGCAENMGYGPTFGGDMAYYDNAYGPFYNGYWGRDGSFYYSGGRGRPYQRDEGGHFRHDTPDGGGFQGVRTHPGWVGHHGGGHSGGQHH